MAEAILVHLPIVGDILADTKRTLVKQVLSLMHVPVHVPPELDQVMHNGLAGGGLAFRP